MPFDGIAHVLVQGLLYISERSVQVAMVDGVNDLLVKLIGGVCLPTTRRPRLDHQCKEKNDTREVNDESPLRSCHIPKM